MAVKSFHMKKKLKKVLLILGSILLLFLLVVAIASLLFFYNKPFVKGILEKQIEKRTGIHITIGSLDYELFPLRIEAGTIKFSTMLDDTEAEVFIQRLVFKGDIHRIRKKVKPYFETIEAEGVRIISHIKKAKKKIMIEDILRRFSSGMSYIRKIGLKNSSLEFVFSNQKLILQGLNLSLSPSESQECFSYTLLCQNAEGIGQPPTNRFQNMIRGFGTLCLKEKPTIEGRFVFTSNRLVYAEKEELFEEINLNFDGEFSADKNEFVFPSLEIEIPSFVDLTASLSILGQEDITLLFRPNIRIDDLSRFFLLAKKHLSKQFEGLVLKGSALFEGEARISPAHPESKASIHGLVTLNPSLVKYRTPEWQLDSHVSGNFKIDKFPDNPNISGHARMTKSSLTGKILEAVGIGMDIPFVYDHKNSKIKITSLKAGAAHLNLDIPNAKLKTDSPQLMGEGFIDLKKRRIQISRANIELHPFPPFEVEAQAGLSPQDSSSFSVRGSGISFQSLKDFFSFAIPPTINDWEPDGRLNIQIEAHDSFRNKQKIWEVSAELEASDVSFHAPSYTVAGESLQPNLTLEGTFDRTFNDIPFAAKIELFQGESLWKDFYMDWSQMPLRVTLSGHYQLPRKKLADISLEGIIPEYGRITAEGELDLHDPPTADLNVIASAIQLAPVFSFFNQRGAASQTQMEIKGRAEGQIEVKTDKNAFSAIGFFSIKDASLASDEKNLSLQGIEAHLPVNFEQNSKHTEDDSSSQGKGFLNFQRIHTASLDLSSLMLDIKSQRNGYSIEPFELEIFGQNAEVGGISIEYGFNPLKIKAQTSFSWKDGDLSRLPFSSQDFRLKGTLALELPRVTISLDHVYTEGQAQANAYGGNITIKNIQVEQPLSKNRTISCDVKLSGLDLEKITDAIPFGRVTGIINGEIQGLSLSYGQPERFNIHIESERRKGIPQRFSLKATNDLAILGTGEKTPFSPQSGWTRFVKDFRYNKIGIACSLKNDIFSLQGTIRKKGVEYLVKGSGLFAINVVNKQARNQIQFKDMLNRLKRIGQSKQSP